MKTRKYRIVRDQYSGYEAQVWHILWPFWTQLGGTNTHSTVEKAESYIKNKGVVKYVDMD